MESAQNYLFDQEIARAVVKQVYEVFNWRFTDPNCPTWKDLPHQQKVNMCKMMTMLHCHVTDPKHQTKILQSHISSKKVS